MHLSFAAHPWIPGSRLLSFDSIRLALKLTLVAVFLALSAASSTASGASGSTAVDSSGAAAASPGANDVGGARSLALRVADLGLENVGADASASPPRAAYENRRYRHSIEAYARVEAAAGGPVVATQRRLGLATAAIINQGTPDEPRFRVVYPSDRDFPRRPEGRSLYPTSHSVDLIVGPLLAYEFGRLSQPTQFQFQIEPRIRYNPWPGARATASLVIPVSNDFFPSANHPDIEQLRPGIVSLEQYAWIPRVALLSATGGLFGDNRWGLSFGAARPALQGALLFDAQADVTGFIAFNENGVTYSPMSEWSSFAGVTWRPPWWDVALRARVEQFVYGDRGEELQLSRSFGDFDLALFGIRTGDFRIKGVRITVPIPPITRGTQSAVRVQPVERLPLSYRTEAEAVGLPLTGVASREEFLRHTSKPELEGNLDRYFRAQGRPRPKKESGPIEWINMGGSTGFIITPSSSVIPSRSIELGYSHIPKEWSFDPLSRGKHPNEPYFLAVGILPRVEVNLRFTRSPGLRANLENPDSKIATDTDHMASFRLALLTAREFHPWQPGLAVGVEDVSGTRRQHSTYLVSGMPFAIMHVQSRVSLGYAPTVFRALRHVLDGGFGAIEVSPWRSVAMRVEYDTEKWNAGIGVGLAYGLRIRAAALDLEKMSVGASWFHEF